MLTEFEHELEEDLASVAVTLTAVTGVIIFWRGVWSLLDCKCQSGCAAWTCACRLKGRAGVASHAAACPHHAVHTACHDATAATKPFATLMSGSGHIFEAISSSKARAIWAATLHGALFFCQLLSPHLSLHMLESHAAAVCAASSNSACVCCPCCPQICWVIRYLVTSAAFLWA